MLQEYLVYINFSSVLLSMCCFKERYLLLFLKPTACLPYYYSFQLKFGCFPAFWPANEMPSMRHRTWSASPRPHLLSDSRLWRGFLYLLKDLQLSTEKKKKKKMGAAWAVPDEVWREITVGRTFSSEWHSVAFWQAGVCRTSIAGLRVICYPETAVCLHSRP